MFINLEYIKSVIFMVKLKYIKKSLRIIGFIYKLKRRRPEISKIIKIINWSPCKDII